MRKQLLNTLTLKESNSSCCIQNKFYTYGDLRNEVAKVYAFLSTKKIENQFIPLVTNDCIETYASILAIWFLGKAYVPISPNYPNARVKEILNQIGSDIILFTSKEDELNFELENIELYNLQNINDSNTKEIKIVPIKDDANLCMLFTSGSSGKPKGVPYTLRNINCTLDSFWTLPYSISETDTFLQMFELPFDMSLLSFLPAFILGACIYTINHKKIKYIELIKVLSKHKITFANMVPSTLNYLKPYFDELHFDDLKYSIFGGEPLYKSTVQQWQKVAPNAEIVNISGPCETTMACMSYHLSRNIENNKSKNDVLAFGKPWKNTTAIIVDENNKEVQNNVEGELCFAGDHVMQAYYKNDALNKQVFFTKTINEQHLRFYKTGDMAYKDEEGFFFSCGRRDFQYKIQGYKVELAEIEQLVLQNFKVDYCVAIVINSQKNINIIYLAIDNMQLNNNTVLSFLKDRLPFYAVPENVFTFSQFPVNLSGKLDRLKLKEMVIQEINNID